MGSRPDLHEVLVGVLGSRNVYFSPPSSTKINYPCIVYSLSRVDTIYADDAVYAIVNGYSVIVIDPDPDSEIPRKLSSLKWCTMSGSPYVSDNLNHYPFTLYY